MVADLKKDYFLLCKKENLARSHSAKNNRRATHLDVTSCTASHITSPTSPCQWNVGFSRQQLDSVFDGDAKSASDVMSDDDSKEVSITDVVLACVLCFILFTYEEIYYGNTTEKAV